ncbi:MAG: DUF4250 domain-containing protein [Pseudobutyrivibrio sp.]|nr:DUF4250 domain-containing protein [Pseudobutyrivibrio sp.]
MKWRGIMNFPKDPVMLLSVVNTALRDYYTTLYALVDDTGVDVEELKAKLASIDYHYDPEKNQFK